MFGLSNVSFNDKNLGYNNRNIFKTVMSAKYDIKCYIDIINARHDFSNIDIMGIP